MLKCNSKTGNANMYDYAFMISLFIWSSLAWKGFGAIEKARSYHYNVEVQRKQQTRIDMTENTYHLSYEVGKIEIILYMHEQAFLRYIANPESIYTTHISFLYS